MLDRKHLDTFKKRPALLPGMSADDYSSEPFLWEIVATETPSEFTEVLDLPDVDTSNDFNFLGDNVCIVPETKFDLTCPVVPTRTRSKLPQPQLMAFLWANVPPEMTRYDFTEFPSDSIAKIVDELIPVWWGTFMDIYPKANLRFIAKFWREAIKVDDHEDGFAPALLPYVVWEMSKKGEQFNPRNMAAVAVKIEQRFKEQSIADGLGQNILLNRVIVDFATRSNHNWNFLRSANPDDSFAPRKQPRNWCRTGSSAHTSASVGSGAGDNWFAFGAHDARVPHEYELPVNTTAFINGVIEYRLSRHDGRMSCWECLAWVGRTVGKVARHHQFTEGLEPLTQVQMVDLVYRYQTADAESQHPHHHTGNEAKKPTITHLGDGVTVSRF